VPEPGPFAPEDIALLDAADGIVAEARQHHEVQAIHKALDAIWRVVADANRYFASQEPWALKTTDVARMNTVLYVTAEVLRQLAILAQPYVPASAERLLDLLAVAPSARSFAALPGRLKAGTELPAPAAIFPRHVVTETVADEALESGA
jgi:methionyl-tRNA synthetase